MTIAIAVQVHDGVALAADSALTLTDNGKTAPDNVVNVYNNGNKIFNLRKGLPIGAMMYGMGSIGKSSISTLVKDLRKRFSGKDPQFASWHIDPENFTIEDIAKKAREFLYEENFLKAGAPALPGVQFGFFVAGFSSGEALSEVWIIEIVNGKCAEPRPLIGRGVTDIGAGGEPEVFYRLVMGHGTALGKALEKGGVAPADVAGVVQGLEREMSIPLVEAPMPIQDALEFAEFLVRTTASFTRFKRGAPTVGGPVESAAITKHEGFKWVKRKHYFDSTLNPRIDHD